MSFSFAADDLDLAKGDGLLPVIVQDCESLRVLMLGYMNREALDTTLQTNLVTFFSRSKQRLWQKGEESGNVQKVKQMYFDSLVFTPEALNYLKSQVGASQIMIGTDHPIPWEEKPVAIQLVRIFDR